MLFMVSLSNFVEILSCPELVLVFNLEVVLITNFESIGSRNMLFETEFERYSPKNFSKIKTF